MKRSIYYRLCMYRHLWSSLYFNIHYFGWRRGIKLPVVFYSPVIFRDMKGKVIINGKVKMGQVAIGLPGNEMFDYSVPCIWANQGGTVTFEGTFGTNPGASFLIRRNASLSLGEHTSFGQNMRILCSKSISIGKELLASWDVTIMDTDSHEFEFDGRKTIFSKPIIIGNHCFVASGVCILKGSTIADEAVIASKSVVSGNLSVPHALYAGVPAKIKKENIKYLK